MSSSFGDESPSLVMPTLLVALLATFVAIMFFEVFGMATASLLVCFLTGRTLPRRLIKNGANLSSQLWNLLRCGGV